jgi:hypothetical protein
MNKYASIETVYKRDKTTNKLLFGELRSPEFSCIKEWVYQEKIDGMNIRLILTEKGCEIRGRTDNAQVPHGLKYISAIVYKKKEVIKECLGINFIVSPVCLYGEGYGAGIQKGGKYRQDNGFALFDVYQGGCWLTPYNLSNFYDVVFGEYLAYSPTTVPVCLAPILGCYTQIPLTKEHLEKIIPLSLTSRESAVLPEGIVARPKENLFDRYGNRIMWKLCFREYK